MIVCKFGGTSVKNSLAMNRVLDIIEERISQGVLLVSSAMGDSTDRIIEALTFAEQGNFIAAQEIIHGLTRNYHEALENLVREIPLREEIKSLTDQVLDESWSLLKGISLLRNSSPRTKDVLLSMGERISTLLLWGAARDRSLHSRWEDARKYMKTDSCYGKAEVDFEKSNSLIAAHLKPEPGALVISQGFIGSDTEDTTTTLGRGGSDYSAAIMGAALDAEIIEIWTDVDGIMTSDPRYIQGVKPISYISYAEAGELAYFGAKVIHPSTMQPAVSKKIPIHVKNTMNKSHPGTIIGPKQEESGLKAISGKKGITLIQISSSRMLNAYGFLKKIFIIFDRFNTSVDLVSTSEVSVSLTIDDPHSLKPIIAELKKIGQVQVEDSVSILSLVGQDLWKKPAFLGEVFSELKGIPLWMISLGSSDINLSMVVKEEKLQEATQRLHDLHLRG